MMRRFINLALLLLPIVARAQDAAPPLDTYETWLRTAYAAATRADRIGLDAVATQIVATTNVQALGGTTVTTDNRWLADALAQEPPNYDLITGRLGALLDALGEPGAANTFGDPQQQLENVFNREPFITRDTPNVFQQFIERVLAWLFDRLAPVFGPGSAAAFRALSPLGWLLLGAGVLLVIGLLVYALRGVRGTVLRDQQVRQAAEEQGLSSTDARTRAQELINTGDVRSAVRYLYLSSLLWLDEHKVLRYERSLTNREYLDQVKNNPRLHEHLSPVVSTFDRVWYGKRPLDDAALRTYQEHVDALRREDGRA
jgi:hypothetical protein